MKIEFRRTGERRYAVTVHRRDQTVLEMSPAAGYDPLMPHDLLHYVVESELGLRSGIFGQIADGGDAGTFHAVPAETGGRREAARRRRRLAKRGARLLRDGRSDSSASERAVSICLREWVARRARPARQSPGVSEAPVAGRGGAEDDVVPGRSLDRILARLDGLSRQWAGLRVGESVVVEWPDRA